ncbi:MAG TPA: hypothetical protein VEU74_04260 [Gemmatimonadales bacterium]|nr:hypothetical protein [Gemmatimonadales bacterium]
MTGRDASRRWWVGAILGGMMLLPLVYSCTEDDRFAPMNRFTTLRADGQAADPFGPPFQVPVPEFNDQGVGPVMTGIVIPPGVQAKVTVTGFLTYSVNDAYLAACPLPLPAPFSPGDLRTVGPAGFLPVLDPRFNGGYRGGEVDVYESTDNQPPPNGIKLQFQPQDASAGTVTATVQGFPPLGRLWVVRPPSFPSSCGTSQGSSVSGFLVSGSQTLTADFAGGGGGGWTTPPCPPTVTISASAKGSGSVSADNPNGSFTAKGTTQTPAEDTLKLHATVSPMSLAARVTWQVKADPQHFPTPILPTPSPGADAVFTVLPLLPGRWPLDHASSLTLAPKQLSFVFTASVQDDQGQTHTSSPVTVTQDDTDTVREEYVEFARHNPYTLDIPLREDFVANVDAAGHFATTGPNSLNGGDYDVYWAQSFMLDGLDGMWFDVQQWLPSFAGFVLTSVFRNPVHHVYHINPVPLQNNSAHQYGLAADIRVRDQPLPPRRFFVMLERAARDPVVSACFEPLSSITNGNPSAVPDHVHVDWMPICDSGW